MTSKNTSKLNREKCKKKKEIIELATTNRMKQQKRNKY